MHHVENRSVDGLVEFDARDPFLDPADPPLECLDAGERNPDGIILLHPHGQLHPAALGRKIEQVDPPAMFSCPAKVDVCAERNPLRPASMAYHSRPPVCPSFGQPSFYLPRCEGKMV